MGSIENILNASKNVFVDNNAPVTVNIASYLNSTNGFAYILQGKQTKNVNVALHITVTQQQREDGNIDTGEVLITSNEALQPQFEEKGNIFVISYKDYKFIVNRGYNYNTVANTYHYTGEILQNRNKKFLILDENKASELFLTNSLIKWLEFGKMYDYKIYPSFLTPSNIEDTFFTVNISDTKALSGIHHPSDKVLEQYLGDEVRISVTNGSRDILQQFLYHLTEQAEQKLFFGLNSYGEWKQTDDNLQSGFAIKSNISRMELKINYYTQSGIDDVIKYIKEATIKLIEE